jgi:hypothetical protein
VTAAVVDHDEEVCGSLGEIIGSLQHGLVSGAFVS